MNVPVSKNNTDWEEIVRKQVKSLRFGVVQIVVHENRVVQIERTEKVRLDRTEGTQPTSSLEAR
jgi:hypothetical protein